MDSYIEVGHSIVASFVDSTNGDLFVCSRESGDILKVVKPAAEGGKATYEVFVNTGGVPNGFASDPNGVIYICDFAHQAILTLGTADDDNDQQLTAIVKDYEGKSLKGPNSVAVDSTGTVYFTDSGPFGGTSLASPKGSVFCISPDGRLLQPLALSCLAHPAGLALSPDERTVYVCETMANRVLRFVQKPTGVYHFSVFYQFGGGLGPTGIACDSAGNIYVARFDFARADVDGPSSSSPGVVSVISANGSLLKEIQCPASEVSGIVVSGCNVYLSEASTNTVYTFPAES